MGWVAKMKYKEIFTRWWFWIPIGISILFSIKNNLQEYGSLFGSEFIGIILGVIFSWTLFFSIGWGIYWIIKKLSKK